MSPIAIPIDGDLYAHQLRPVATRQSSRSGLIANHQRSPSSGGVWRMSSRDLSYDTPPLGEVVLHGEPTAPPSVATLRTSSTDDRVEVVTTGAHTPHSEEEDRRPDSAH
jgi:hypothetical protein